MDETDRIGRSYHEWTFYDNGYHFGKRCYIEGWRKGNRETFDETILDSVLGRSRKVRNRRGGVPEASPGDKSYAVPEYSEKFHKVGSTLPAVNFSRSSNFVSDTFIPLQPLPKIPKETYSMKEKVRLKDEEKNSVVTLTSWKPAPPLVATL